MLTMILIMGNTLFSIVANYHICGTFNKKTENNMININEVILSFNDDKPPAVLTWDDNIEDYTLDIPKSITRLELIELVREMVRITSYEQ